MLLFHRFRGVNMDKKSKTALGIILSLLGGVFWGFSGSCGQYLFTYHSVDSKWIVTIRMISTGIILLIISFLKHRSKIFGVWKGKKNFFCMSAFTLFGLILCQYSYFTAIAHSNAGTATVLQYLSPVMILIFVCMKNKKLPALAEIIAIILAVGGTFVIATGGDFGSFSVSTPALLWGIASAVFLACYSLIPASLTGSMVVRHRMALPALGLVAYS
jgi:drug/metabolite transporter (DMT)-like permease